jgi:hypothetical protein
MPFSTFIPRAGRAPSGAALLSRFIVSLHFALTLMSPLGGPL